MLSDKQWAKLEPLLPKHSSAGRPWKDNRAVLEGILWILKTGARWRDLPSDFGVSPATCWRRLHLWEEHDVWLKVWRRFLAELDEHGQLDWSESFIDGSFAPAKKGAPASAKPSAARAQSGWWWSTARVFLWETTWTARRPRK
jgi:transposase